MCSTTIASICRLAYVFKTGVPLDGSTDADINIYIHTHIHTDTHHSYREINTRNDREALPIVVSFFLAATNPQAASFYNSICFSST